MSPVSLFVLLQVNMQVLALGSYNQKSRMRRSSQPNPSSPPCKTIPPDSPSSELKNMSLNTMLDQGISIMDSAMSRDTGRTANKKKAIFMLGNTGMGKTTVVQITTGNLNHLHAAKTNAGKLVIIDDNMRIGAPTTRSKTLIPEYVIDPDTGVAFWDNPGFDDTRGSEKDIAAMYFLRYALDTTSLAKFLFVTSHSSLEAGDRLQFDKLVEHAVTLFKNVTHMRDSIGLVVTKVGSYSSLSGDYLEDEEILEPIFEFLETYVRTKTTEMKETTADESMRSRILSKIQFVQAVLGRNGTGGRRQPQIFFVRSPTHCGSLNTMSSVLESRKKITELYSKTLTYIPVTPQDFRFTLKKDTLLEIQTNYLPETKRKLAEISEWNSQVVESKFRERFYENLFDMPETSLSILNKTGSLVTEFLEDIGNSTGNPSNSSFSTQLEQLHHRLEFNTNCSAVGTLKNYEGQLDFFNRVLNKDMNGTAERFEPSWVKPWQDLATTLGKMTEFYEFCDSVQVQLAEYDKVGVYTNLLKMNSDRDPFRGENVLQVLNANRMISVSSRVSSLWGEINNDDKNYLSRGVRRMAPRLDMKCLQSSALESTRKYRLVVTGRNVKLSDVLDENTWPAPCSIVTIKELVIVALQKIFVDKDFDARNMALQVSMIAPRWEVVLGTDNTRNFTLDGTQPQSMPKANSAVDYGARGNDGMGGLQGSDAGSFLGIYSEVQNWEKLFISANGGDGGNGQEGGDGYEGAPGMSAAWENFPSAYNFPSIESLHKDIIPTGIFYNQDRYIKRGESGLRGGDGGSGGAAGRPGSRGSIQLFQTDGNNETVQITTFARHGNLGTPGIGGSPGRGGKHGNDYTCLLQNILVIGFKWGSCRSEARPELANSGRRGNGGSAAQANNAVTPISSERQLINEYMLMHFNSRSKLTFPIELQATPEISRHFSTLSMAEELVAIETFYYELGDVKGHKTRDYFVNYYEIFLKRLRNHGDSLMAQNQLTLETKTALSAMYATVLGKVIAMRRADQRLNVIKTKDYFDALALQMETLKTAEKEKVIQDETQHFHNRLDNKIREALYFVQNTVQPAIQDAQVALEGMNAQLMEEVSAYIAAAEEDLKEKKRIKREYEALLPMKQFMSILGIAGSAVSFLGPYGAAAGSILGMGTSIAQNFLTSPGSRLPVSYQLPASLGSVIYNANMVSYKNKAKSIEQKVNLTLNVCKLADGDELSVVRRMALKVKRSLQSLKRSSSSASGGINAAQLSRVEAEMGRITGMVVSKGGNVDAAQSQPSKNEKIMSNLGNLLIAGDSVNSLIQTNLHSASELERLSALVIEAENNLRALDMKKDQFYNEIMPQLQELQMHIAVESGSLPAQSQVGLSVKKWKIKDMVKGMRWYLQQYAKGFQVLEHFQVCYDRLEEALTLLVDLYDHMEKYEEKKEFADYIANVNAASSSFGQIGDPKLRAALVRLDFFIQANLFLTDYQNALHAFKQWVFPFANNYLAGKRHRNTVAPTNIGEVVSIYKREVKDLRDQLAAYKATTNRADEALVMATFTSGAVSSRPFYVWAGSKWHHSIDKLLSGEPIQLKADVNMEDQANKAFFEGKSAIKYKVVDLMLKAHNASRQGELDAKLRRYQMEMTHSGISVYKVKQHNYVMFDHNQTYAYSFERIGNEMSVSENGVRYKVKSDDADYMLSPYTWWSFQLVDATPEVDDGFTELKEFGNQIDLELEGKGVYLNERRVSQEILSNLKLGDYYEVSEDTGNWRINAENNGQCSNVI